MIIEISQIIIAFILIALILIQERSSGLSGTFGGTESGIRHLRRGGERFIFNLTVILLIIFIVLSLLNFVF